MGNEVRIDAKDLKKNFYAIFNLLNVDKSIALHVVEGLVQTSLRGVDSHGVRLFPHYVRALQAGRINGRPNMAFQKKGTSVGRLDADHTYGHAAGAKAMGHAMDLARNSGVGAVAVFNSSHFGAAAYYGLMAAQKDMIGLSFTHADALTLASGGKEAYFGTNPLCVTAPVKGEEPFCLDMATSTITWNKVKMYREANKPLPEGIAADQEGNLTTDPHQARCLLPIGDFKGFGLGMVVDVFCSLLTGMPFGQEISNMYLDPIENKRYLGQFYMAINISKFVKVSTFKARLKQYMDDIRQQPAKDPNNPIMVAGDPEKKAYADRIENGIPMSEEEYQIFLNLNEEMSSKV